MLQPRTAIVRTRLWMLAVAGLAIASVVTIVLGNRPEAGVRGDGKGDAAAYRQIVDRMRSGSDYAELWAGICLGHSAVSYARNQPLSGVAWAVVALFFRELAAPFCVVAGVRALWQRERGQIAAWAVGAVAFVAYYVCHLSKVLSHIHQGDPAQPQSWLALAGSRFCSTRFVAALGQPGVKQAATIAR